MTSGNHIDLPEAWITEMRKLLAEDAELLISAMNEKAPTSIRFNPFKPVNSDILDDLKPVPWIDAAYYLSERPSFTLDPLFHAGAYYVQEAASMFIYEAIQKSGIDLDNSKCILDLCAAPGGKSTLLTQLGSHHMYVSNELIRSRYNILSENITRWGSYNHLLTQHNVKDFEGLEAQFDIVLVDAPCSGEGMFRKDMNARSEWSPDHVDLCASRQKRILASAAKLVKEGGLLIYSTCTFNEKENEDNVRWLTSNFDYNCIDVKPDEAWGIQSVNDKGISACRFYPHRTISEGLFLSVLQKQSGAGGCAKGSRKLKNKSIQKLSRKKQALIDSRIRIKDNQTLFTDSTEELFLIDSIHYERLEALMEVLRKSNPALKLGKTGRKEFIPEHALAMTTGVDLEYPVLELTKVDALKFLKKDVLNIETSTRSWHIVKYKGLALGWIKILDGRINNYLPKSLRILMSIDYASV